MSAPQGQSPPQGLEKGESYCENTKKPATSIPSFDTKKNVTPIRPGPIILSDWTCYFNKDPGSYLLPGPQGEGLQGSGFSTHLWFWQTQPWLQSGSMTHSGLHPINKNHFQQRSNSKLLMSVRMSVCMSGLGRNVIFSAAN